MTVAAPPITKIPNYVDGQWREFNAAEDLDVINPATGEALAKVPHASAAEVARAVEAVASAWPELRRTPPEDRNMPLIKLKQPLELLLVELRRSITTANGKTF